ncbi:MAG: (d)CMP kinase [Nitrospirota bacterium]
MKDIITIDGPSGAGKSTIARMLARKLGYKYLDTGALYRAVAWKAREDKADIDSEDSLKKLLKDIVITFESEKVIVNGIDVTSDIRTGEIGELSSRVSAMPVVREGLFSIQREMGLSGKAVIEGRDTGTAIFPESENKFFLDAGLEERAKRRHKELIEKAGSDIALKAVTDDISKRDARDSTRESSPLKRTEGMFYIDTSKLTIEQVIEEIIRNLKV